MNFYERNEEAIKRLEESLGIFIINCDEKRGVSLFLMSYNDFVRAFQSTSIKEYTEALKRYNKMADEFFNSFDIDAITNSYRYLPSTPENYTRLGDEIERAANKMLDETGSSMTFKEHMVWIYRRWFIFEGGENL